MSKVNDRIATFVIILCASLMALVLLALLGYIFYLGLGDISWQLLTSHASSYQAGGGIVDQIWNSIYLLIITLIISVPLGVLGGIYLAEYAEPNKWTAIVRTCVEVLSSLPSIVVGLFGLLVFDQYFHWGYSVLSGAFALTVFNLPVLVRVSEDAIRSVPQDVRQGSLALGVTRWHTIKKVVLPASFSGILTGVILTSGRIFGESAALLFTAGLSTPNLNFANWNPASPESPLNLFRSAETLSVHIWYVNTNGIMPDVARISNGGSAVLVILVLLFNLSARFIGGYVQRRASGSK